LKASYEIRMDQKTVGSAFIEKQGLFYAIHCKCQLPPDTKYRIVMKGEKKRLDLGICIPDEAEFVLTSHIPISRIGEGPFSFSAELHNAEKKHFLPVHPEKPFNHIPELVRARFTVQDQIPGVIIEGIKEKFPIQQDNDQNP